MKKLIIVSLLLQMLLPATAKMKKPSEEAAEMFNKVYKMVFASEGTSFGYSVNIIGIYKTEGTIKCKGKKMQYNESRFSSWEDGITAHKVDKKKKTISIYRFDDERKDPQRAKFKYDINNFDCSYKPEKDYYIITGKVKNASFFGIREFQAKVWKKNLYPVSITIKVAFMRTTIQINNFKMYAIADSEFVFPKNRFPGYKVTDYR